MRGVDHVHDAVEGLARATGAPRYAEASCDADATHRFDTAPSRARRPRSTRPHRTHPGVYRSLLLAGRPPTPLAPVDLSAPFFCTGPRSTSVVVGVRWHPQPWIGAAAARDAVLSAARDAHLSVRRDRGSGSAGTTVRGAYVFRNGSREALATLGVTLTERAEPACTLAGRSTPTTPTTPTPGR